MTSTTLGQFLGDIKPHFEKQNSYALLWEQECNFAKQQILRNEFTRKTASENRISLQAAIQNVAAIGVSLNPALAHAYLVPRDGMICLDVSFRGLIKLATDSGAIEWAKAELVYEGDTFKWRGPAEPPLHEADPFDSNRVDQNDPLKGLQGAYCIAKLTNGGYMVEVMPSAEIVKIRNTSKAKNGPWKQWAGEMAKKTIIKRASKSWPQVGGRNRIDQAIEILNQHEGIEESEPVDEGKIEAFKNFVASGDSIAVAYLNRTESDDTLDQFNNCWERGQKTKMTQRVRELIAEANKWVEHTIELIGVAVRDGSNSALEEIYAEFTEQERYLVEERMDEIQQRQVEMLREAA